MDDAVVIKRQGAASIFGGFVFGSGWWVFIDGFASCTANVEAPSTCDMTDATKGYAWLPPFGATVAYIMINGMKWSELRDDITGDSKTTMKARLFLLFAMLIGMVSMAGAGFLMGVKFLNEEHTYRWSGVSCFVATLMIMAAGFLQRMGTTPPADY